MSVPSVLTRRKCATKQVKLWVTRTKVKLEEANRLAEEAEEKVSDIDQRACVVWRSVKTPRDAPPVLPSRSCRQSCSLQLMLTFCRTTCAVPVKQHY